MDLVLASTSRYRRELMERLGLPFRTASPRYRETPPEGEIDPRRLAVRHALGKALSLLLDNPGSLIIGSDQVITCGGEIFSKPGSNEKAVEQLLRLAGREHELVTAIAVVRAPATAAEAEADTPGETAVAVNHVRLRPLTPAEAEAYVLADHPLDCAGAYRSESLGVALIEYLRGDDPTAVIGLPLISLVRLLRHFGVDPLAHSTSQATPGADPPLPISTPAPESDSHGKGNDPWPA